MDKSLFDQIDAMTENKSADEIYDFYTNFYYPNEHALRQMCRKYFFRNLTGTDEEHPLECDIRVDTEGAIGLSSLQLPNITSMWLDDHENITCILDDSEFDIEFFSIYELMSIVEQFKEYEKCQTGA